MKKQRRFIFTMTLTGALLLIAASCGKKNGTTEGAAKTVDFNQHETFTVWLQANPNDWYSDYSENPAVWYLNEMFNVTLQFQQPPAGTEADALSLMFGTAEYTDMIDMNQYTGSITQLYEDGVVVDIAEYLDYMPNFKKLLEIDEGFRRACYDDDGRILTLRSLATKDDYIWGGLVYRHDILETMTGGNVQFPSGSERAVTIADWEYMLPLFKMYFEKTGRPEYAPFILPAMGTFGFGELVNGFGVSSYYYIENDRVHFGVLEDGFYNYLKKMREWYEKGYIYRDFASRTNDPFFLPNTSLTYGGMAGIWYGLQSQLGGAMSMPQYGLNFDVQPLTNPLDTDHGITEAAPFSRTKYNALDGNGFAITKVCKNVPKLLSVMDFMFSHEGSMLYLGLTKEQGADRNPIYIKAELQDGAYWFEEDRIVINPLFSSVGGIIAQEFFVSNRLPNLKNNDYHADFVEKLWLTADEIWGAYPDAKQKKLPSSLYRSAEEDNTFSTNSTRITDYMNSSVPQFIMGTVPLNDQTWTDFKSQLKNLGIEENLHIQQAAYDRWLKR